MRGKGGEEDGEGVGAIAHQRLPCHPTRCTFQPRPRQRVRQAGGSDSLGEMTRHDWCVCCVLVCVCRVREGKEGMQADSSDRWPPTAAPAGFCL